MTTDATYELAVTELERKYAERLRSWASDATYGVPRDETDEAVETVAAKLFDDIAWEHVKATDISDIAYEAVQRAYDNR